MQIGRKGYAQHKKILQESGERLIISKLSMAHVLRKHVMGTSALALSMQGIQQAFDKGLGRRASLWKLPSKHLHVAMIGDKEQKS